MIMKTTNTGKNQEKLSRNFEKCRSHLNHNLYSENFISNPLNVFSKPIGTIIFRIMIKDFKRTKITKSDFFQIMETRVIEVQKLILIRKNY